MPEVIGKLPDGTAIHAVTLRGGGLWARVLTLGATVQDLRLKGVEFPLVVGSPDPLAYLGPMAYAGAMVGRFANRIGGAGFVLDGQRHILDANWRGHCVHGGTEGSHKRVWEIITLEPHSATLGLRLPDGEMGFPGNLDARVTITLESRVALSFDIRASTDRATPCSFSHHGYFRLDDGPDLRHHCLRLSAAECLEMDADLIPTGRILPATGALDFSAPRSLDGAKLDHAFCLAPGKGPRPVAWLDSSATGLALCVETTAPGLQLYTAQHFPADGLVGLDGRRHGPCAGLALEAQEWPDAPNHPHFPPAILRPGSAWHQRTSYIFTPRQRAPS